MVLEKTLECPLDCKEIQPVNAKGDQSWVFIGRTDFAAETPIFWPPELNIQKTKIMAFGPITSWEIDGETLETVSDFIFGAPKSLQMVTAAMKLKDAYSLEEKV